MNRNRYSDHLDPRNPKNYCCMCVNVQTGTITICSLYVIVAIISTVSKCVDIYNVNYSAYTIIKLIFNLLIIFAASAALSGATTYKTKQIIPFKIILVIQMGWASVLATGGVITYYKPEYLDYVFQDAKKLKDLSPQFLMVTVVGTCSIIIIFLMWFYNTVSNCYKMISAYKANLRQNEEQMRMMSTI
ncbi:hypothetical protein L596_024701 [Steinernema carpocapsae]|uniref:Uncharacterized protein n=1 Tax=Steinernema carpocapsae TaxID=34508 RepID=A0A4V5ZYL9_STECR|nr:hypothetical protein L596_024701 [Steinernema carpocapsae]